MIFISKELIIKQTNQQRKVAKREKKQELEQTFKSIEGEKHDELIKYEHRIPNT